jgi:hypothetical protein
LCCPNNLPADMTQRSSPNAIAELSDRSHLGDFVVDQDETGHSLARGDGC